MDTEHVTTVTQTMRGHPCFDEEAHDRVGRVHLPVAARCNIQCAFCEHRVCANLTMQHPGWTRELLSPAAALERLRALVHAHPGERFVVGIAGPGEPLDNEETFGTLELAQAEFPELTRCLSSNGLLLEQRLPQILAAGVSALTVTVNAVDAEVGERIYAWVHPPSDRRGAACCAPQDALGPHTPATCCTTPHAPGSGTRILRGTEGAALLIEQQQRGIRAALAAGLAVKVNTVLVPGINDQHVTRIAETLRALGVPLMNLMPLLPAGAMRALRAPTCEELAAARVACEAVLPQFRRCEHCRADAAFFPAGIPPSQQPPHDKTLPAAGLSRYRDRRHSL